MGVEWITCRADAERSIKTTFPVDDRRSESRGSTMTSLCGLWSWKLKQSSLLGLGLCLLLLISDLGRVAAQRSTGGRNVLRRNYTGKKPVVIQHLSQDAVSYYDHENGAKIIKSSHFELDYTLGRKITFFCMAQGNPRPTITWFKDGAELYQHRFFQVHESHIETDIIKSYYECQADNIYAIDRRGFRTDYVMVNF
ncbi:GL22771 [Drosophila persimilis]|uniref:GL22771 n=1 Tax=Drosophila persimilis TaxID=7234 RepID=B4GZM6_DROPE|nr:GL22771 [Drosophila persimilis]